MANINVGLSNTDKAKLNPFAQKIQKQVKQDPTFKKDVIESALKLGDSATLKANKDYVTNPLAGNPPASKLAPLPRDAHEVLFTLFDAIKSISEAQSANSLMMNDDVNAISSASNRLVQLGNQIEAFQNAQADIQKSIQKEEHHDKILGWVEQAVFGATAVLFAGLIAGPAGMAAALLVVGANAALQDSGAYDKMTKHMTPAEAFGVKLAISLVMGALAGGITGIGITALESASETEGETVAAGLGRSGLKAAASDAVEGAVGDIGESLPNTVEGLEGEANTIVNESGEIQEDIVEEQIEDKLEEVINSKGKSDEPAGGVKTKSLRLKRRAGWSALNTFQTMTSGTSSETKEKDGSFGMIGDLIKAAHGSDNWARGLDFAFNMALMAAEVGLGAWAMNGAEAAESSEKAITRILRQATKIGLPLQTVAGFLGGAYGTASSFTQRSQLQGLGTLAKQLGDVDKDSELTQFLQTLFTQAMESSNKTNQEMMNTVFSIVQNINTALGAATGSRAA